MYTVWRDNATMTCAVCDCDDHPNRPCECLNCIGNYQKTADYNKDHTQLSTEHSTDSDTVDHKPRYVYSGKTGVIRPKK
jgi:hypothetical protein